MKKVIFIISISVILYSGCSKSDTNPVLTGRALAVSDYNQYYLASNVSDAELGWTGNTTNCVEGTISQVALDRSLTRLNYFRKICGLSNNMVWNSTWFSGCQKAALMMYANNTLSHTPPSTWKCYTAEGASTAGVSNIALGSPSYHSSTSITAWIQDDGANNIIIGHRRWMLFSRAKEFGLGCTTCSSVLECVAHTSDPLPSNMPAYIAYPPTYIPQSLVFARWSFAVPNPISIFSGVDFSNATITMTDNSGANVPLNIISKVDNGYADQTIVWEPQGVITNSTGDLKYHVVIDHVSFNGVTKKYEYDVNIIKP